MTQQQQKKNFFRRQKREKILFPRLCKPHSRKKKSRSLQQRYMTM